MKNKVVDGGELLIQLCRSSNKTPVLWEDSKMHKKQIAKFTGKWAFLQMHFLKTLKHH